MPSPKKSEILRRILRETSNVYTRFQPTNEGWNISIDSTERSTVDKFEDKDIESVSQKASDYILENREELLTISKRTPSKKFVFTGK